jgi:hypothetical protein
MASVAQELQYPRFRFLPKVECVSGDHDIVPVVKANTSNSYAIVPFGRFGQIYTGTIGSLPMSNGFITPYSLTIATSDKLDEYNPEMVAALLKADAEKPEASFANVIDMMEWLERD